MSFNNSGFNFETATATGNSRISNFTRTSCGSCIVASLACPQKTMFFVSSNACNHKISSLVVGTIPSSPAQLRKLSSKRSSGFTDASASNCTSRSRSPSFCNISQQRKRRLASVIGFESTNIFTNRSVSFSLPFSCSMAIRSGRSLSCSIHAAIGTLQARTSVGVMSTH